MHRTRESCASEEGSILRWVCQRVTAGAVVAMLFFALSPAATGQTLLDPELELEEVITVPPVGGLSAPTTMAFLGLDDILVRQKNGGQVRRVVGGALLTAPVLDVAVNAASERGLLGRLLRVVSVSGWSGSRIFSCFSSTSR